MFFLLDNGNHSGIMQNKGSFGTSIPFFRSNVNRYTPEINP